MSLEDNLFEQRLARTRQIQALGFRPYGRRFEFTHTIPEIVAAHGGSAARTGSARPSEPSGAAKSSAEPDSVVRASSLETRTGPARPSEPLGAAKSSAEPDSVVRASSLETRTGPARPSEPSGAPEGPAESGSVVPAGSQEALDRDKPRVSIAGRIQTMRRMGKAGFLHLMQSGERLQVYVRKDAVSERDYSLYEMLDLGDILGVEGYLFRTRTGELSVHAEKLTFLSKTLLSMPEKWHGIEDVELRYRQRYLDLIANPDSQRVFRARARMISSLRRQLEERGFIEVETPMMQPLYGGAAARPFVTHHNTLDMDLYLRIAPELYLKRLIVGGMERVYEINRNFRNEGISVRHNPEFTMLEFYQAYTDYHGLMDFTEELLKQTAIDVTGSAVVTYQGEQIDFGKMRRMTMREAVGDASLSGHALMEAFEARIEPNLIQPTLIYDYPVEVSPLSKNKLEDPAFVERFEIYAGGIELGNAYTELNDPQEQYRRFELQRALRAAGDEEAQPMDEDYLRAMSYGMPPTGGEGIGIDRLAMLLTDSKSIRDVILFPLLRPEGEIGIAEKLKDPAPGESG